MAGWLTIDVLRGKDVPQHCYVQAHCAWGEVPPMNQGEADAGTPRPEKVERKVRTAATTTSAPTWNKRCLWRTKEPSGKVTLAVYQEAGTGAAGVATTVMTLGVNMLVQNDKKLGEVEVDVAAGNGGEGWYKLRNRKHAAPGEAEPAVYLVWRCSYSKFARLFEAQDEEAPPPYTVEYSSAQLQVEVQRLSAHSMTLLNPLWWGMAQWCWERPYESAVTLAIGLYVCYHNILHVAFPGTLFLCMVNSFVRRFKQGPQDPPPPPALGFLGTISWVKETLKWTQGYLMWVCDTLDYYYDIYMWEHQKAAEGVLKACALLFALHWVLHFSWSMIFMVFWLYMYTYYPLGYYMPQLYIAIQPQNIVPVLAKVVRGQPVTMRKDGALHVTSLLIPTQEKREDKSVYYKIVITNADGKDAVVWHRFNEFDKLKQRLQYIAPDAKIDGFPSKTMFTSAKGETLTKRRTAFEAWLTSYIELANTNGGKSLRVPLAAFLKLEI